MLIIAVIIFLLIALVVYKLNGKQQKVRVDLLLSVSLKSGLWYKVLEKEAWRKP